MRVTRAGAVAFAMAFIGGAAATSAAELRPAVLDQPAIHAARPTKSALLTLALAGPRIVAAGEKGLVLLSLPPFGCRCSYDEPASPFYHTHSQCAGTLFPPHYGMFPVLQMIFKCKV